MERTSLTCTFSDLWILERFSSSLFPSFLDFTARSQICSCVGVFLMNFSGPLVFWVFINPLILCMVLHVCAIYKTFTVSLFAAFLGPALRLYTRMQIGWRFHFSDHMTRSLVQAYPSTSTSGNCATRLRRKDCIPWMSMPHILSYWFLYSHKLMYCSNLINCYIPPCLADLCSCKGVQVSSLMASTNDQGAGLPSTSIKLESHSSYKKTGVAVL